MDFEAYKNTIREDAQACLAEMGVQPILFVGSGLSQRYFGGPSWERLLTEMAERCPVIDKEFAYYKQKYPHLIDVGTAFAESYREWAWGKGRDNFEETLFEASQPASIYLKYAVAHYFEELLPQEGRPLSKRYGEEIGALKAVRPHAIITTNYDRFLEMLFLDYTSIIGQQILHANYSSIGEILKIHGCSSQPSSIVLTREDYDDFFSKKKYLSAKLLTFFSEHPLLFLGYNAGDPNIQAILSDIDEILAPDNELIPNVYIVEWNSGVGSLDSFPRERLIPIEHNRSVRVKSILADEFSWVFQCFESNSPIEAVNPKLLRALMARTFRLVRHDIPKRTVEVDYQALERAVSGEREFGKLFGITTLHDPSAVNAMYPYLLTQVGKQLGYKSWHEVNLLIQRIHREKGIDIKASDNRYHIAIRAGNVTRTHKYAEAAVELLFRVKEAEPYQVVL